MNLNSLRILIVFLKKNSPVESPLNLPMMPTSHSAQELIPHAVQQSLPPGVQLGNITALNTDQHLFFNFNSRMISRFAPLWENMVSRSLYQWLQNNNFPRTRKSWVTNVEVILNKEGEVLDIQHFRLSGLWPFDEAPIKAFKQVKQIPNPPAEMVDENGLIRIKLQTEVHWLPQRSARAGFGSGQKSY